MKEVRIDEEECIGCESCVELCPDVFSFNAESNKAYVTNPNGGDQKCIEDAAASCPVSCITNE